MLLCLLAAVSGAYISLNIMERNEIKKQKDEGIC